MRILAFITAMVAAAAVRAPHVRRGVLQAALSSGEGLQPPDRPDAIPDNFLQAAFASFHSVLSTNKHSCGGASAAPLPTLFLLAFEINLAALEEANPRGSPGYETISRLRRDYHVLAGSLHQANGMAHMAMSNPFIPNYSLASITFVAQELLCKYERGLFDTLTRTYIATAQEHFIEKCKQVNFKEALHTLEADLAAARDLTLAAAAHNSDETRLPPWLFEACETSDIRTSIRG